ncbi:hypothetical protein VL06_02975 [Rossellomorea marisflavi]|nr:hypothetical protein VL06_02975 [Rossellomorea marisflavi]
MKKVRIFLYIALAAVAVGGILFVNQGKEEKVKERHWMGAWMTAMQESFDDGESHEGFKDQTVRMVVKPHVDGDQVRIRLSNAFSDEELKVDKVSIGITKKGAETKEEPVSVSFDGKKDVRIPAGERTYSDSIPMEITEEDALTVSLYFKGESGPATWHPRSMQTTYSADGDTAGKAGKDGFKSIEKGWYWLDGVDVRTDKKVKGSIVVLGSSIDNGNDSKIDSNHRWTDYLSERINDEADGKWTVLNAGISANQLLDSPEEKGEKAPDRLKRDVFEQTGVKGVIVHQGINDIRHHPETDAVTIIDEMKAMIKEAHKNGVEIYGVTISPYNDSGKYTAEGDRTRRKVNAWMRNSGAFDGVIDFDKVLRNPDDPSRLQPKYNSGDGLHPNEAGYRKMAETVKLKMFEH